MYAINAQDYPFERVEALLAAGDVKGAVEAGWWGNADVHALVGGERDADQRSVQLDKGRGDLGFDLSNEAGAAVVTKVSPFGVAGEQGQLRAGDLIRKINGETFYTCEGVVRAIMLAEGVVDIVVVRPAGGVALLAGGARLDIGAQTRSWSEERRQVAAGATLPIDFESEGECVLCYRFETAAQDIGLRVVALASSSRGVVAGPPMLSLRAPSREGALPLPPGKFRAEFDNAFSYLRGKELTYHLRLLPKAAWAEERRKAELERLTAEVAARRAKHAELGDALKAHEAREAELKAALQATERAAAAARDHRERNKAALQAAQAQLKELQEEREPGAAAAER